MEFMKPFTCYMGNAISVAKKGAEKGEVPVGAVLVYRNHPAQVKNSSMKTAEIHQIQEDKDRLCSDACSIVSEKNGIIIALAHNMTITNNDPTAHAEILAIRLASVEIAKINNATDSNFKTNVSLENCDMYVTLEPCPMCAHAIALARIRRLYYGTSNTEYNFKLYDAQSGYATFNHIPEVYPGIMETECSSVLHEFFAGLRSFQKTV